jgi:hypothetical protein
VWISERVLREVRGESDPYTHVAEFKSSARHVTYISKVIQHPSRVVEVQIKKEKTDVRAGQYIFVRKSRS